MLLFFRWVLWYLNMPMLLLNCVPLIAHTDTCTRAATAHADNCTRLTTARD
jgi:bacteriorhodopsin